jgi:hypothetical protein
MRLSPLDLATASLSSSRTTKLRCILIHAAARFVHRFRVWSLIHRIWNFTLSPRQKRTDSRLRFSIFRDFMRRKPTCWNKIDALVFVSSVFLFIVSCISVCPFLSLSFLILPHYVRWYLCVIWYNSDEYSYSKIVKNKEEREKERKREREREGEEKREHEWR